jgi:hypothetical protein
MQIIKYPLIDKWEHLCQRPVFEKKLDNVVKKSKKSESKKI